MAINTASEPQNGLGLRLTFYVPLYGCLRWSLRGGGREWEGEGGVGERERVGEGGVGGGGREWEGEGGVGGRGREWERKGGKERGKGEPSLIVCPSFQ